MYPARFAYHRTNSFEEASAALISLGHDAKAIAGGQSLIPLLKLRLARPTDLVDIGGIAGADRIEESDDAVVLGALIRHAAVGASSFAARHPVIRDCAIGIADVQVRNMGTIGGSLAEADPNSCWPTLLSVLDARVRCLGPAGTRGQSVRELLADAYTPNLEAGELITSVIVPRAALAGYGTFVAFKRSAPAYPTVSCALMVDFDGDSVRGIRLGLGCVSLTPVVLEGADEVFGGQPISDRLVAELGALASEAVEPFSDNKGSDVYKRSLVVGLVRRAFDIVDRRRRGINVTETHFYYG